MTPSKLTFHRPIAILLGLILFSGILSGQIDEEWVSRYNGAGNGWDEARSIVVDDSGNVFVTGGSVGSDWFYDYITIKYNSSGVEQWIELFDGLSGANSEASSIAIDASSNVYVTGYSTTGIIGNTDFGQDFYTIKYNSAGTPQWSTRYDGGSEEPLIMIDDGAEIIKLDGSGNVYVGGYSENKLSGEGDYDFITIKYNNSGLQQWAYRYDGGGGSDDLLTAIAVSEGGDVIVTGCVWVFTTSEDCITIKYPADGSPVWIQQYNGPGNSSDGGNAVVVDEDGNVYVAGFSYRSEGYSEALTIKYNSGGVEQWVRKYSIDLGNSEVFSIAVSDSGNVFVTGYCNEGAAFNDYLTIKYNSAGTEQWVRKYDDDLARPDWANSIALDGSGNVYVTGCSQGFVLSYNYDYATIKYNAAGTRQWVIRYNGDANGDDEVAAIALDNSGNVYVTGRSQGPAPDFNRDYATIKYSPVTSTESFSPTELTFEAYPNPSTGRFRITNPDRIDIIEIYNLLGESILSINESEHQALTEILDLSSYPQGIYIIKISSGSEVFNRKILLQR